MTETASTAKAVVLNGLPGLQAQVGRNLGISSWRTVDQDDITAFAQLTGDQQWIHVDPQRASNGPYGTTIQHGFLTLGWSTGLLWEVCTVEGFSVVLNYGLNKVRFPAPLLAGSRVRMRVELHAAREIEGADGTQGAEAVYRLTYEVDRHDKPCCVADLVFRYYN